MRQIILACCRSGNYILKNLLDNCEIDRNEIIVHEDIDFSFNDSEMCANLVGDPLNKDVFIFQSLYKTQNEFSTNDNLLALLASIRAYKEYGAKSITAVIPYLSYARQDKAVWNKMEPVTIRLISDILKCAGVDNLITYHSGNVNLKGYFYGINFYDLSPDEIFIEYIENRISCDPDSTIILAPDRGAQYLVKFMANAINLQYGFSLKERISEKHCQQICMHNISYSKASRFKTVIIADNAIFSGMTLSLCLEQNRLNYEPEKIYILSSHIDLSTNTLGQLETLKNKYSIEELFISNSISFKKELPNWIQMFDISPKIFDQIKKICQE